jgi:hypothetical protein
VTIVVVLCASVALGCGGGIKAPDLFIVYRTGNVAGARLTLLVNEEGGVHCNGRLAPRLSDPQLINARVIQEDLQGPAEEHKSLPAQAGSVLSYYVRDQNGTVRFSDDSTAQPHVFRQLAQFVLQTAQQLCRLPL